MKKPRDLEGSRHWFELSFVHCLSDELDEFIDVGFGSVPGAHPADDAPGFVPNVERGFGLELGDEIFGKAHEYSVRPYAKYRL